MSLYPDGPNYGAFGSIKKALGSVCEPTIPDYNTPECVRAGEAIKKAEEIGWGIICRCNRASMCFDAMAFDVDLNSGDIAYDSNPVLAMRRAVWSLVVDPSKSGERRDQRNWPLIKYWEKPPIEVLRVLKAFGLDEPEDWLPEQSPLEKLYGIMI